MPPKAVEKQSSRVLDKVEINILSGKILDAAIEVHRTLGPGLLESVYEECLYYELRTKEINVERQCPISIVYKGQKLNKEFIIDLFAENEIIIELKTVDKLLPIHEAQLLTYLKLAGKKLGLLINFNDTLLKDGYKRLLNGKLPEL